MQLVHVDVFGSEAGPQDIVRARHDLDAHPVQVGVHPAGRDVHRLARLEGDCVEQQRRDDAGIARTRMCKQSDDAIRAWRGRPCGKPCGASLDNLTHLAGRGSGARLQEVRERRMDALV